MAFIVFIKHSYQVLLLIKCSILQQDYQGVGVNSTAKSNMYSVARDTVLERYAPYIIDGNITQSSFLFCVVSHNPLNHEARQALERSAQALGYGAVGCFFVVLSPKNDAFLESDKLFSLIEGIDPLALVIADSLALQTIEQAYRIAQEAIYLGKKREEAKTFTLQPNKYTRILGRDAVTFSSFEATLSTPNAKQRAWAILKKLRRAE